MSTETDQNNQTETEHTQEAPAPVSAGLIVEANPQLPLAIFDPESNAPLKAFTLTKTGIIIQDDLTLEQWREGLKMFRLAKTSLDVGLADYLSYGRIKYGTKNVHDALEQLEFALPDITRALDISTIPEALRHESLTAEHYVILARADITPSKKVKWARTAAEQHLSATQLKSSIAAGEVVSNATSSQQQHGIVNIHGIRGEFDIWMRRVGGVKGILKMDMDHRNEILGELKPMFDLYHTLSDAPPPKEKKAKKKAAIKKKH